jgi:hypothetical protein
MSESPAVSRDDLLKALAGRKKRVASTLNEMDVAGDLDAAAQQKLAALVWRHDAGFRIFRQVREGQRRLRLDARHGPAQRRMFFRKLATAIKAVQSAVEYATDDAKTDILKSELQAIAAPRLLAAKEMLAEIGELHELIGSADALNVENPRAEATADLVRFFAEDCRLSKFDADTRIAEIFNRFRWRTPAVPEDDDSEIARETEAVRKRRSRARPPK